jgi:glycosyltransferase involved in cell wall biosynthesis
LIKVLFLAAPFKSRFIERMTEFFSSAICWKMVISDYPPTKRRAKNLKENITDRVLETKKLSQAAREFKPDVIYTDNLSYSGQAEIISYLARVRAPHILHLRGNWWTEYLAWYRLASWNKRLRSTPFYFYYWYGIASSTLVTPICRWLERGVKHYLPWKPTEVVYQGVDPKLFYKEEGFELEHPAAAIIQNHTVYPKTLGLLAFRRVIERVPDVHFYIATGERRNQPYFPLVEEKLGGLGNVHFLEDVSWPEGVRRLLSACDMYILASGLDCCPTTVLEASLMEKPVLASKIGGVPEIVAEGETGWTLGNNDVQGWAEKIRLLANDRSLSALMGKKGRLWVSERFTWEKIGHQVEEILTNAALAK